jgi:serpin B
VLANAIWFKGNWSDRFDKRRTVDQHFYLERGGKVRVPLMSLESTMPYVKADGFQVAEVMYAGHDLSMLVFVPDRREGLAALEARLSAELLDDVEARLFARAVKLFLPKFTFEYSSRDLSKAYANLGMPLPFERWRADFSGINGYPVGHDQSLFISDVFHKAFVQVDEYGTEAAAATAVGMDACMAMVTPQPIPIVRADHPFLFAIRDRRSRALMFLGRVADPAA